MARLNGLYQITIHSILHSSMPHSRLLSETDDASADPEDVVDALSSSPKAQDAAVEKPSRLR